MVLRLLGPGLVTGAADDDPSGIATYSQAGAQFGYGLLWTVFLATPFMIAIQLVSARIGRVTGKGLAANVMALAPRWLVLRAGVSPGRGEHVQYRGRHRRDGRIPFAGHRRPQPRTRADLSATVSILLQVFVPYRRYSPVLKFLTLTLFAYVATAFTVNIPWSTALAGGRSGQGPPSTRTTS